jgi:radical SAM-linked protein
MAGEVAFPDNRKWQTKPGIPGAEGPAPHYLDGLAGRDVDYLPSLSAGPIEEPPLAPEDAGDEVRFSYRITWTKTGDLRMLSHREVINVFYRALRRTGLLLQYTKGFHPKPKIGFGPALPLGVESLCEEADIHLAQDLTPEQLIDALNAELPTEQGITVVAARCMEKSETSVQASIDTQRYRVELPDLAGAVGAEGRTALRAAVAELMATDTLAVKRNVGKRITRTVNLRPMVVEMLLDEPPGNRFQGILAPAPDLCFTTRIGDGGMCPRPRELLGALLASWPEVLASARVTKLSVTAVLTDTPESELIEV